VAKTWMSAAAKARQGDRCADLPLYDTFSHRSGGLLGVDGSRRDQNPRFSCGNLSVGRSHCLQSVGTHHL
jgi:hypothetical protein